MCLENRLSGRAKEKAIAKLPKTFMVWKFCPNGLKSEYNWDVNQQEPLLVKNRRTKAKYFPEHRENVPYLAGFHAFLKYREVIKYFFSQSHLRKFEACRVDVKEIGSFDDKYYGLKGVVLSHIKPV